MLLEKRLEGIEKVMADLRAKLNAANQENNERLAVALEELEAVMKRGAKTLEDLPPVTRH